MDCLLGMRGTDCQQDPRGGCCKGEAMSLRVKSSMNMDNDS